MTIEQYYQKINALKAPADMPWTEHKDFYTKEKNELKKKLSASDLEKVEAQERNFANKMQSSVG